MVSTMTPRYEPLDYANFNTFVARATPPPDISTAVPVCNALSLVFTAATAAVLGEKVDRPLQTLSGMVLVLAGLAVCVASKA